MRAGLFADTSFYVALADPRDGLHGRAKDVARDVKRRTITTEYILTEVGNWLCRRENRASFLLLLAQLQRDPKTTIVPGSHELFQKGVELYRRRPDKDWSVTDCISFVVMEDHGITEALTADGHFEQAGFAILLK